MTTLETILEVKRREAKALRAHRGVASFADERDYHRPAVKLSGAIRAARRPAVIAEIKRSSPSAGVMNAGIVPAEVARGYRDAGASVISVLTDATFFGGSPRDLLEVRRAVETPLLRKDFIVDEIQVHEARAIGADALLLIMAALDPSHLADLHALASELGLECLVEIHSQTELTALEALAARMRGAVPGIPLVGINNRDLRDLSIDLGVTLELAGRLPAGTTIVSESGLRTAPEIRSVVAAGAHAVLIGEHLMRGAEPGRRLQELLDELRED